MKDVLYHCFKILSIKITFEGVTFTLYEVLLYTCVAGLLLWLFFRLLD